MAVNPTRSALSRSLISPRPCRSPRAGRALWPCHATVRSISQSPMSSSSLSSSTEPPPAPEAGAPGGQERPRWDHTPERMIGPGFSINMVKDPRRKIWSVNDDPRKLDQMYNRLLGGNGHRMLPDETKWLAVTHKSFDHGRRGFNTRLACFGRHVLAYETTRSILANPTITPLPVEDAHGRQPFEHAAMTNVDKLNEKQPQDVLSMGKVVRLATEVGLQDVVRWKPRKPENLKESGVDVVLTTTLFAIVGAISLQHGAEVAARVVRERILKRLGA